MTGITLDTPTTTDESARRGQDHASFVAFLHGRRRPVLIGALAWGAAVLYVLAQAALGPMVGNVRPARAEVVDAVIFLVMWGAATPAILRSASWLPITRPHVVRRMLVHLALASAFVLAINLAGPFLLRFASGIPVHPGEALSAGARTFARLYHLALIVYAFILGAGHYLRTHGARLADAERAATLSKELAEARAALQLVARAACATGTAPEAQAVPALPPTALPPTAAPLAIKEDGRLRLVEQSAIDWIEADDDHVVVHVGPATFRSRERLRDVERRLDASLFVRIHRSTIVQMSRIRELEPWFRGDYVVVLQSGMKLRLSRNHRERLASVLGRRL